MPVCSEVFRDRLEGCDLLALAGIHRPDDGIKAVVQVVLDQDLLCLANCLLHRVHLLGDRKAGPLGLDHRDHAAQVALGAP
jgi:hypothetical protein